GERRQVKWKVGGQSKRRRQSSPRGLHESLSRLESELLLGKRSPSLQHIGDCRQSNLVALFRCVETCPRLGDRGSLGGEERDSSHVIEIRSQRVEDSVLNRRVVCEAGREKSLLGRLDGTGPAAEIQQQIIQRDRRPVIRPFSGGTGVGCRRLDSRDRRGCIYLRIVLAARRTQKIRGCSRLRPRGVCGRIVS